MLILQNKFFISNYPFFNHFLLNKYFSKNIYSKFLIITKFYKRRKKYCFEIDNFFDYFVFKLKKRYSKFLKIKYKRGKFLTLEIFNYKHSKLKYYKFFGVHFTKNYIKKNFYLNLNLLKNSLNTINLFFIYKSVRGGFLGFSNNLTGFLPLAHIKTLKKNLLFYKRCFLLKLNLCFSFFNTNSPMLFFYNSNFIRNYNVRNKKLRRLFFRRFRLIFRLNTFFLKKYIKYFLKFWKFFLLYNSKLLIYYLFLKVFYFLKI